MERFGVASLSRHALIPLFLSRTVLEGMDIVKAIEAVGSPSGKPSQVVEITDAGELPAPKKAGLFSKKK